MMRVRRTDLRVLVSERKVSRRAESLCSSASENSNLPLAAMNPDLGVSTPTVSPINFSVVNKL